MSLGCKPKSTSKYLQNFNRSSKNGDPGPRLEAGKESASSARAQGWGSRLSR